MLWTGKKNTAEFDPSLCVVSPVYQVAQQHSDIGTKSEKGCGPVLARSCSKCNPKNTRTVGPPAQVLGSSIPPPLHTALILGTVQTTIQGFLGILRGGGRARRWSGRLGGFVAPPQERTLQLVQEHTRNDVLVLQLSVMFMSSDHPIKAGYNVCTVVSVFTHARTLSCMLPY